MTTERIIPLRLLGAKQMFSTASSTDILLRIEGPESLTEEPGQPPIDDMPTAPGAVELLFSRDGLAQWIGQLQEALRKMDTLAAKEPA